MASTIGDRVTAVLSANPTTIKLLGHGVYQGDLRHPQFPLPNPCIQLDNGSYVWGFECWCGPEAKVLAKFQKDFPNAVVEVLPIGPNNVSPVTPVQN